MFFNFNFIILFIMTFEKVRKVNLYYTVDTGHYRYIIISAT